MRNIRISNFTSEATRSAQFSWLYLLIRYDDDGAEVNESVVFSVD